MLSLSACLRSFSSNSERAALYATNSDKRSVHIVCCRSGRMRAAARHTIRALAKTLWFSGDLWAATSRSSAAGGVVCLIAPGYILSLSRNLTRFIGPYYIGFAEKDPKRAY